jgi:hypothetical protein
MVQVHRVLRNAIQEAPALFETVLAGGPDRVEQVGTYYANVLDFLKVHHEGEDEVVWPLLCERAPEHADEVRRIAGQHDLVTRLLDSSMAAVATFRAAPDASSATAAAAAIAEVGEALLPHLDEEEAFIVPLAAKHIYAPEWGQLPGLAMRTFGGDKLWLILGLIREQFRAEQIAMMDANMPPPVFQMWNEQGEQAFTEFISELRKAS